MCSLLFKVNGSIMFPSGNILSLVTKISSSEDFKVFRIGNKHSVTGLLGNSERSTFLPLILRAKYSVCGETQPYNIASNSKYIVHPMKRHHFKLVYYNCYCK